MDLVVISLATVVVDNHTHLTVVVLVVLLTLVDLLLVVGQMVVTSLTTTRDTLHGVLVDQVDTSTHLEDPMVESVV